MSVGYQQFNELAPRHSYTLAIASTSSVTTEVLPLAWRAGFVTITADRLSYVLVSETNSITCTTGVGSGSSTTGIMVAVPAGTSMRVRLDGDDAYLFHCATATSRISVHRSSP